VALDIVLIWSLDYSTGFQSVVPSTAVSTSPGNLLEIKIMSSYWDILNKKLEGPAIPVLTSRWFWYVDKFKNLWLHNPKAFSNHRNPLLLNQIYLLELEPHSIKCTQLFLVIWVKSHNKKYHILLVVFRNLLHFHKDIYISKLFPIKWTVWQILEITLTNTGDLWIKSLLPL